MTVATQPPSTMPATQEPTLPLIRPAKHSQRTHRCHGCASRKFRTLRDLALHILAKHGHAQLPCTTAPTSADAPMSDDVRSVTFTSPSLSAGNMVEIDQLLAAVTTQRAHRSARSTHRVQPHQRVRSHTACSRSVDAGEDNSEVAPARRRKPAAAVVFGDHVDSVDRRKEGEGESVSPIEQEIFLKRYRSGAVQLVPIHSQPTETLNFAQGLF